MLEFKFIKRNCEWLFICLFFSIVVFNMANNNSFNIRSILEKEKLNGKNFLDWQRNLQIVLMQEEKEYVLDEAMPEAAGDGVTQAALNRWIDANKDVKCLMLATMSADLQKTFINSDAFTIISELKNMFQDLARVERFETHRQILETKLKKGEPVSPHVLKMIGLIENMSRLDQQFSQEMAIDTILHSLHSGYDQFKLNYSMNSLDKTLTELHGMLKTAEKTLKSDKQDVLMVRGGKFKKSGKKRNAKKGGNKASPTKQTGAKSAKRKVSQPTSESECFYCKKKGHWKRDCLKLKEDQKNGTVVPSSGIFVIDCILANSTSWVLDTGCGSHLCSNPQGLRRSRKLSKGEVDLRVGNGARIAALAVGTYYLSLPSGLVLELEECFHVPSLTKNIISVSCLDAKGFSFLIKDNSCSFYFKEMFYGSARLVNGLYLLDHDKQVYNINTKKAKKDDSDLTYLWHCRLGHINLKRLERLQKEGILEPFDLEDYGKCESCLLGKMTKQPFSKVGERANELLGLIHTDVCGPMSTNARGGFSYFITFTDDFSRYGYVYLMKHKSESFDKFKEFQSEVENQLGKKIKALRSDRGGEYLSYEFDDHLKECGILSELTPPGTPQWNGVSERRNRTLLDMVRSMMGQAELPLEFWGHALNTAALTINRAPSKAVEKTPYELWFGKPPNVSFLKIWGCEVYVKRLISDKLHPKSDKCILVGYPKETKGYYFYNTSENKVFVARDGVFLEKDHISKMTSGRKVDLEEIRVEQQTLENAQDDIQDETQRSLEESGENHGQSRNVTPRRSQRYRSQPERYLGILTNESYDVLLLESDEPATYKQAMTSPSSKQWQEAMQSELDSMSENQVWDLVDLPDGYQAIGSKWVFKLKKDKDGKLEVFKARLVAKGYRQVHGVDYDETFSPVAMLKSIRIMLAIAAYYDYEIWQMDVKTAFLNGVLTETVFMTQPEGFEDPKNAKKVCKLKKSIYGLKQASRSWNIRFDEAVSDFGFIKNADESCVYKKVSGSKIAFLVLYVDDILLIGNDIPMLNSVKIWLGKCFSMKDLGEAQYILGIKIYRDRSKKMIGLSQSTYINKVLDRFKMADSKRGYLPMSHGMTLSKTQCPKTLDERRRMNGIPYASLIGSIMYAMICTRPDVAYALSATSRYQSDPGEAHWTAAKNILKYLKRHKDDFLVYGGDDELIVKGYTDASFQTDKDDFRSQSGFVFCLNGGAVSWKSAKQSTIADSTTEAEYIAAHEAAKEAIWLRKFIGELGVVPSIKGPIALYCDNNGAIAQAKEPRHHQRVKHVLRRFHLLREFVERKEVEISKIGTDDNISDPLTKPLPQAKHNSHTAAMGIKHIGEWL